jgi:hypothetical protein
MDRPAKAIFTGIALFFVTSCAAWAFAPASFCVTNGTDQPISILVVEVHDRWFEFRDIPPGGSVRGRFRVGHEATLIVSGHFADGNEFGEPCGYVVWEDPAPHVAVLVRAGEPWLVR